MDPVNQNEASTSLVSVSDISYSPSRDVQVASLENADNGFTIVVSEAQKRRITDVRKNHEI